jgi:hypothetical protein
MVFPRQLGVVFGRKVTFLGSVAAKDVSTQEALGKVGRAVGLLTYSCLFIAPGK